MTPHPGDLLSAYADGELSAPERVTIDDHLVTCPSCRQELAATTEAKSWVTSLPEVPPPLGFYERMLLDPAGGRARRRTWATRIGVVGLAATASIWLGVLALSGLNGRRPSGVPALNSLVTLHDQAPRTSSTDDEAAQQQAAHLGLPPAIGTYELVDVVDRGREQQAIYLEGADALSIFLFQRYDIDESRLPNGTEETVVDGRPVWLVPDEPSPMLVTQIGPNAVVVIGGDAESAMAGDVDPHTPGRSLGDRIEGAGEGLLQAFGLG
jgi:Putative zinc-finger